MDCPDGTRVTAGQSCPVRALPPRIIFFSSEDSDLTEAARSSLDEVINDYRRTGSSIRLAGHTDRRGTAASNLVLAQRYTYQVRDYLLAGGVARSAITIESFGESRPAVATPDDVPEPDNRRVEITFEPGSGW